MRLVYVINRWVCAEFLMELGPLSVPDQLRHIAEWIIQVAKGPRPNRTDVYTCRGRLPIHARPESLFQAFFDPLNTKGAFDDSTFLKWK